MKKNLKKIEYGDFQTPPELAQEVCNFLNKSTFSPRSIIEPTCGVGALFLEALRTIPSVEVGHAFDIEESYIQILKQELKKVECEKKIKIQKADFFKKNWTDEIKNMPGPVLIIGNPPWVTNSQLGQIKSNNLPQKINHKKMKGLDALTGKSNFDISEWMINQMIEWIQNKDGAIAMLCKTSVARKVLINAWKHDKKMQNTKMHIIDSRLHFNISADACLLSIESSKNAHKECEVFETLSSKKPIQTIGYRDGYLVADIPSYEDSKHLIDTHHQYKWRTGIKHDCAKVMELEKIGENLYLNGFGETHELESSYLYPLLKGSDLSNGKSPRKFMIVPQSRIGQDTKHILQTAPNTWKYLQKYGEYLDKRGSSIYKGKPRFSIFGVGDYTFSKWKIAIPGLYKKLQFSVIGPYTNKPIVFDDTVNFIPLNSAEEASKLAELLNSKEAHQFYKSFIFWDSKRPITVQLLKSLDIDMLAQESDNDLGYRIGKSMPQLQLSYS